MVAPHSICLTDWLGKCFNFMDGINGITILYALTIISFALLPLHQDSLPANYNGIVLCSFWSI
jgi:hypothetical protein